MTADQFCATNEKEYAGEGKLCAFERDQLAPPPLVGRRFELIPAAAELRARKALAERIER